MGDKQALRKLIEAVDGSDLSKVNQRLADMYSDLGDEWPWDWMSMVNSAYKGSLDAAKALHEALLPGWRLSDMGESDCTASGWFARVTMRGTIAQSISAFDQPRASRAWLLAILRAYEAQK